MTLLKYRLLYENLSNTWDSNFLFILTASYAYLYGSTILHTSNW